MIGISTIIKYLSIIYAHKIFVTLSHVATFIYQGLYIRKRCADQDMQTQNVT